VSRPAAKHRVPAGTAARVSGLTPFRLSLTTWWQLTRLIAWVASLGVVVWGLDVLADYARGLPPPGPCRLVWVQLPDWLRKAEYSHLLERIEAAAEITPETDIRAPDLARRVYEGLTRSPWIARVERVVARGTGALEVTAQFREPTAFVEYDGRAHLVDGEGVRLPADVSPGQFPARNYFLITGVKRPPPPVGRPWDGDELAAGLRLAAFLERARQEQQFAFGHFVRAIDVSQYDSRVNQLAARLRLATIHAGCFIEWGNPPGEETGEEASANRKLVILNDLYSRLGQLPETSIIVWWPEGWQRRVEPPPPDRDRDKPRERPRRTR